MRCFICDFDPSMNKESFVEENHKYSFATVKYYKNHNKYICTVCMDSIRNTLQDFTFYSSEKTNENDPEAGPSNGKKRERYNNQVDPSDLMEGFEILEESDLDIYPKEPEIQ